MRYAKRVRFRWRGYHRVFCQGVSKSLAGYFLLWVGFDPALAGGKPVEGATSETYQVRLVERGDEGRDALGEINAASSTVSTEPKLVVSNINPNDYVGLYASGPIGANLQVEVTDSLNPPVSWKVMTNTTLSRSPLLVLESALGNAGTRFYKTSEPMVLRIELIANTLNGLVRIPPGTFLMGSPPNEALRQANESQHEVTLTCGFWMGQHEVTQAEYESLMGTNPSNIKGSSLPVGSVSWFVATEYCLKLTEREANAGRLPTGYAYRLPTEAEWEYACRAGTTTAFHHGTSLRSGMANFRGSDEYDSLIGHIHNPAGIYLGKTAPVGSFAANAWGLHDMHGNAWEWCSDWYGEYPLGAVTDPLGKTSGVQRVLRGGSWFSSGSGCRAAFRDLNIPGHGSYNIGFRVVLAPIR